MKMNDDERGAASISVDWQSGLMVEIHDRFVVVGQTRPRNNASLEYSGSGAQTADSPHSGRTSFFSKISSRFSKR